MRFEDAQLGQIMAKCRGRHAADDQDIGMVVKYIGSGASGKVQVVEAAEHLVFTHGALGSEVADTTIQIGSTPGSIDVTEATANIMGEVVDHINASANWEAYLVDMLRDDNSNASTGSLKTAAAAQAKVDGGLALVKDTSKVLNISLAIDNIVFQHIAGEVLNSKANQNYVQSVLKYVSKITNGSGDTVVDFYSIDREAKTEKKIFSHAGGATTVEQTKDLFPAQIDAYKNGNIIMVRVSGTACAGVLSVLGKSMNTVYK